MAGTVRTVWFHRAYERFTGGHLKHAHYFDHVRRAQGFAPVMTFGNAPQEEPSLLAERERLWPASDHLAAEWTPARRDVLFVAGTDWRYLDANGLADLPNPRINLVQHVRHAHPGTELHGYLDRRAVRVCVSEEVADAVCATGRANGPVLAIPNGIETAQFPPSCAERRPDVLIVAYKRPDVGRELADLLGRRGVPHRLLAEFLDRGAFLALLAETDIAVCLPRPEEGFYLPALEAMAAGCTVVTMDCVGNRGFCRHEDNCLVGTDAESLGDAVLSARSMPAAERELLRYSAAQTVRGHALSTERARFHAVLKDIDRIWHAEGRRPVPSRKTRHGSSPVVDFMIVGAQKCGTTALAHFLGRHPDIGMSSRKEVHLFDSPEYSAAWSRSDIDRRYGRYFEHCPDVAIRGEATPIYMYVPEVAAELRRYNPGLKLIVLLRDPVDRAISEHRMQRDRRREHLPLWLALLAEPFRLRRDADPRKSRSETREHSYRIRGLFSRQMRNLHRHFPKEQVLVLRSDDLRRNHDETMRRVLDFLGADNAVRIPGPETVFADGTALGRHRIVATLLSASYAAERVRLRRLGIRL